MSTRATYEIDGSTFYIHHDGYPTGAAQYLFNMVKASNAAGESRYGFDVWDSQNCRGGLPFAFIRGNGNCEPTDGHDAHGDTEYRYTVKTDHGAPHKGATVRVDIRCGDWLNPRWETKYFMPLVDFINAQYRTDETPAPAVLYIPSEKRICTLSQANRAFDALNADAKRFEPSNPNHGASIERRDLIHHAIIQNGLESANV